MTVIDECLKNLPPNQKSELERVRKLIQQAAPEAVELISYGMPAFKPDGKYLIGFAAFKNHMSLFPGSCAIEDMADKLKDF